MPILEKNFATTCGPEARSSSEATSCVEGWPSLRPSRAFNSLLGSICLGGFLFDITEFRLGSIAGLNGLACMNLYTNSAFNIPSLINCLPLIFKVHGDLLQKLEQLIAL